MYEEEDRFVTSIPNTRPGTTGRLSHVPTHRRTHSLLTRTFRLRMEQRYCSINPETIMNVVREVQSRGLEAMQLLHPVTAEQVLREVFD